jgi:hypothetical protein
VVVEAHIICLGGGGSIVLGSCFLMFLCRILLLMNGSGVPIRETSTQSVVCIKCLPGRRCTTTMMRRKIFGIKMFL